MARKTKANEGVAHFSMTGELTIFIAQPMKELLMPLIAGNNEIEIDLSHVTEVDGAGMQLMIAAKREAILQGKSLRYVGHSKPVLDMLDLCDLVGFFSDPVVIPSQTRR